MQWRGGETISHLSERTKQNAPRKTYAHISTPTNLRNKAGGLMIENNNAYKTI